MTRRVTLLEVADILGLSKEAIRKRVTRDTLRSDRGEDGRRYVYLDAGGDVEGDEPSPGESDALISELRDRLHYVERQLEAEREENRENRRLLMAALERIPPALEAPPAEPAEGPAPASEESGGGAARTSPAEPSQRRSWWRRMFRG